MSGIDERCGAGRCFCGCCEGIEPATPLDRRSRPGLPALRYRIGTHSTFLESMLADLTREEVDGTRPLQALQTRDEKDPTIAFLDAAAAAADVLTFYQERVANEGYLRTATERRSVLELARLVGYVPRPGLAASAHLAFTIDENLVLTAPPGTSAQSTAPPVARIPAGTRVKSTPIADGELPQTFETSFDLVARPEWNALAIRMTRPQTSTDLGQGQGTLYLEGTGTKLQPNDLVLVELTTGEARPVRVRQVESDFEADRTLVSQSELPSTGRDVDEERRRRIERERRGDGAAREEGDGGEEEPPVTAESLLELLRIQNPEVIAADSTIDEGLKKGSLASLKLLELLEPRVAPVLFEAWSRAAFTGPAELRVAHALRASTGLFGATAPSRTVLSSTGRLEPPESWPLEGSARLTLRTVFDRSAPPPTLQLGTSFEGLEHQSTHAIGPIEIPVGTTGTRLVVSLKDADTGPGLKAVIPFLPGAPGRLEVELDGATGSVVIESGDEEPIEITPGQTARRRRDQVRFRVSVAKVEGLNEPAFQLDLELESMVRPDPRKLVLDALVEGVAPGSWVVVRGKKGLVPARVEEVTTLAVSEFGITGRVTRLLLDRPWLEQEFPVLDDVRDVEVFLASEELKLAGAPIEDPVKGSQIDLGSLAESIDAGRRVILSGERADVAGVQATELAMIAAVSLRNAGGDRGDVPGEKPYAVLSLTRPLTHSYVRSSLVVHGNVAEATHGETQRETLGSGDGTVLGQEFRLSRPPLTFVPAATLEGSETTLTVRVDEVAWREKPDATRMEPGERSYLASIDDDDVATVHFGDGVHGARLPTGIENVTAEYRAGLGSPGNLAARQLGQLVDQPYGVQGVINPMPSSGGADRDGRDAIRRKAPVHALGLGRLVSLRDYEDLARNFAGVAKASARRLSDGRRRLIHVTIAGVDDVPIEDDSELLSSLRLALLRGGDPQQVVSVARRELEPVVIGARIRILASYVWQEVRDRARAALLDHLSFDRRELGQPVYRSEILAVLQEQAGIDYVDLDTLATVDITGAALVQDLLGHLERVGEGHGIPSALARRSGVGTIAPAQLAYLPPEMCEFLSLLEIES